MFFALCTSRLPFDDRDVSVVLRKVRDGRFTMPDWIAPPAKDLITRMLEVDLDKRITVGDSSVAIFCVTLSCAIDARDLCSSTPHNGYTWHHPTSCAEPR